MSPLIKALHCVSFASHFFVTFYNMGILMLRGAFLRNTRACRFAALRCRRCTAVWERENTHEWCADADGREPESHMSSSVSGLSPLVEGDTTNYTLDDEVYTCNGGRTYTPRSDAANTTAEPSQPVKCSSWHRGRAEKNPNDNCLYLSLGEGLGLYRGYDNLQVSETLRANVARTLRANLGLYAEDICVQADTEEEKKLASKHRALWVQSWIENTVEPNGEYADDDICVSAAAVHYQRTIVVFFVGEVPSAVLFPDGTRVFMYWEQLCKRFPSGVTRDSLIVVLYNGNYTEHGRVIGNHFDHAKLLSPSTTLHTPRPAPAQQERPTQLPQGMQKWQTPSRCVYVPIACVYRTKFTVREDEAAGWMCVFQERGTSEHPCMCTHAYWYLFCILP